MGGFLRGFSQGITDGQKLGEIWNNGAMQRQIKDANGTTQTQDPQYSQDQVAQLRDPAEASGGVWDESTQHYKMPNGDFVAPTTTPTYSDGHYQTADGTVVAPKNRFSLGNRTQDTAFTAEDIATEKLNRKADIYSSYGKEDLAEQMRGNALARGLQQRQLKKIDSDSARDDQMSAAYETVNTHNDNTEKIATPLIQAVQTGKMSLQEAMPQILAPYNANLPNGEQLGYDQSKGHLYKTQNGKVEVVKGTDGKPLVVSPEHLDDFLNLSKDRSEKYLDRLHAKLYPELYMDRKKLEMQQKDSDRNYLAGRDDAASVGSRFDQTLKQTGDQFREKQSFDMAVHNDKDAIDQAQLGIQQQELGLKGRLVGAQAPLQRGCDGSP